MTQNTPQEQAENMLAGIKHTYQVVAKRHVHPWYTWAILAAAIGFTVGVAYVSNKNVQFDESQAAKQRPSVMNVRTAAINPITLPGRLAERINTAIKTADTGIAKIETGRLVELSRGPGVFFDAPQPYNLRTTQGSDAFSSDLRAFLSGSKPFRVSIGNSPANEWLAFGSAGTIPSAFAAEGQRCDCSGSVSFAVTCNIGGENVVITRSAHAIANALDNAVTVAERDAAFAGSPNPADPRNLLDTKMTINAKNSLRCPQFQCDKNLSACIPKIPPDSTQEVLALAEGAGYSCSAYGASDAAITSTCNAAVVNPAQ
jgi:hypothetical protein